MNVSQFLLAVLLSCSLPALAQPEVAPRNGLPYALVAPDEVGQITGTVKPIVLHLSDMTLRDALAELGKQTNLSLNNLGGTPALEKKLSLDLETTSFWTAFRALLKAAGTNGQLQRYGGHSPQNWFVQLGTSSTNDFPLSGTDGFEVRAINVGTYVSKNVSLSKMVAPNRNSSLTVSLSCFPDPRIPLYGVLFPRVTRAEDDKGRSLQTDDPQALQKTPYSDYSTPNQFSLRLRYPSAGSQKIARLEGVLVYVVPSQYDVWKIEDVLNAKDASHDFQSKDQPFRVALTTAQQLENRVQLTLEMTPSRRAALQEYTSFFSSFSGQLTNYLALQDANGYKLTLSGLDTSSNNGKTVIKATFARSRAPQIQGRRLMVQEDEPSVQLNPPYSFTLNPPIDFVQTEVPFSFSNLPLP